MEGRLFLLASLPSVSPLPFSGSPVGVPGPMGQDSELLQSGLVVA